MYPTLFHFFYDWFGIKIQFLRAINSFGFFVAISFISGAWLFGKELERKYKEGLIKSSKTSVVIGKPVTITELITNALIGFLLGYKLIFAFMHNEVFSDFPKYLTSSQGSWVGGIVIALAMAYWKYYEKKKTQLPEPIIKETDYLPQQHVGPILLLSAVFGILGAKLFAYLENPGDIIEFLSDPFSGLTMYGGLICATLAGFYYFKKHNLPAMHFMDAVAPILILSYGIGRIGCHVAGDGDWGIVNINPNPGLPDWLWAYDYPNNVNHDGVQMANCFYNDQFCYHLEKPVYPTPLYESIMSGFLFALLWFLRKRIKTAGLLFSIYLFSNGVERFLIEQIRVNDKYDFVGIKITQAEIIALSFMIIASILFFYFRKKQLYKNIT